MVSSILGFTMGQSQSGSQIYNGHKFYRTDYGYKTKIDGKFFDFQTHPSSLEALELSPAVVERIRDSRELVLTYDQNQTEVAAIAASQDFFARMLSSNFMIFTRVAFTEPNDMNMTVVTCEDATPFRAVIDYRESNETKISMEGDCIIFEAASARDFFAIKDRVLYSLLGIMG